MWKIQVLRKKDFPSNDFFKHLLKGTEYYQRRHFERAIEEWNVANKLHFTEPINLEKTEGRIFCGSVFKEIPFLFFLYAIYSNMATGIAVVKTKEISKKLMFKGGLLISAATTRREERIGNFIVKRSNITPEILEQLVIEAKQTGERLGKFLVKKGFLSAKTLRELLTLQIEEIVSDIFFWQKGQFYFFETPINEEIITNYTPIKIALTAAQRGFNFTRFRKQIPNNKVIFRLSPYVEKEREEILKKLDANEQFIFSLIDGVRNIDQLINFSGCDEVSVINALYRLSSMGLIRKTKEVGEYQDKEFMDISTTLNTLVDIFNLIVSNLFYEIGLKGKEIIGKARQGLKSEYRKIFVDVSLEDPDKLDINAVRKNIAFYFPSPQHRFIFIDAFHDLYINILDELKKFLGLGLAKETISEIEKMRKNIERFDIDISLKERLLRILDEIVKKY